MAFEEKKRPSRIPLTPEEVSQIVALKKLKEARLLARFKKSSSYKFFNVFNICCFFIYLEILFCFFGPCHYQLHYGKNYTARRGDEINSTNKHVVVEMDIVTVEGKKHKLYINDFVDTPEQYSAFQLGKDFILQKELKAVLENSDASYGLQSASSVIFLTVLMIFICCSSFFYNLNENPHSLTAIAILNAITVLAISAM